MVDPVASDEPVADDTVDEESSEVESAGYVDASRHVGALRELSNEQAGQTGWQSRLLLLVISGFIFVGAGANQWNWQTTILLMGVLFLHELGHFVSMKLFGYRNLKMFFLPLFGAAVSGKHYNVPGWKKTIVSLAGPVPGIAVGTVLGIWGAMLKHDLMVEAAYMMLFLNALNLLPILPFDGGWVAHELFFSRHHIFDVLFRLVAVGTLVAAGWFTEGMFLFGLAFFMFIGIPGAYRIGRVRQRLKLENQVSLNSEDATSIPLPTAVRILDEVNTAWPAQGLNDRVRAQLTINIFQALNSRPPGILATIGLTLVHVGSFVLAVVAAGVIVLLKSGEVGGLPRPVEYRAGDLLVESGDRHGEIPPEQEVCVIGEWISTLGAADAWESLREETPVGSKLVCFGNCVLLSLPADDLKLQEFWRGRIESKSGIPWQRDSKTPITAVIEFDLPLATDAKVLRRQINSYLSARKNYPVAAPWSPFLVVTDVHSRARNSYHLHQGHDVDGFGVRREVMDELRRAQEEVSDLQQQRGDIRQAVAALQQANRDLSNGLKNVVRKLGPEIADEEFLEILMSGSAEYEPPNIADEISLTAEQRSEAWDLRIRSMLGCVADQMTSAEAGVGLESVTFNLEGEHVTMTDLVFGREVDGLPALLEWLAEQGATNITFMFDTRRLRDSN